MYILGKISGKPLFMCCSKVSSCKYRVLNLSFFRSMCLNNETFLHFIKLCLLPRVVLVAIDMSELGYLSIFRVVKLL